MATTVIDLGNYLSFCIGCFSVCGRQFIDKLSLQDESRILLTQDNRPRALIILNPEEESIKVYDFDEVTASFWPAKDPNLEATFSDSFRKRLFYSYAFSQVVDHEFTYLGSLRKELVYLLFLKRVLILFSFREHKSFLLKNTLAWEFETIKCREF